MDWFSPAGERSVGQRSTARQRRGGRSARLRCHRTRRRVKSPQWTIDPIQVAGGAQELLDEVAASKISGEEDIFSHTDLWDFNANLEGAQTAVASVRPILDQRNPDLSKRIDQRFAEVEALLAKYRSGDGFVLYTSVTDQQRQELSRAIDALSKEVSQVQGAIAFQ